MQSSHEYGFKGALWHAEKAAKGPIEPSYRDTEFCKTKRYSVCTLSHQSGRNEALLSLLLSVLVSTLALPSWISEILGEGIAMEPEDKQTLFDSTTHDVVSGGRLTVRSQKLYRWSISSMIVFLLSWSVLLLLQGAEAVDLRASIIEGNEPCFQYIADENLFRMNCSILRWTVEGYGSDTFISLEANDIFDGDSGVGNAKSTIDLTGITSFEGLFAIKAGKVAESPLIKNIHVRKGKTAKLGGFIVRKEQQYFIVDSCSSTGDIAENAGGICGFQCARDNGKIRISNCYSTGRIIGPSAGGITGKETGINGGTATIIRCHSSGNLEGVSTGGICGSSAGASGGQVHITKSYSTGNIIFEVADYSGGIVASLSATDDGYVEIRECYSTGEISADYSGGIIGSHTGYSDGEVHIIDCYTRGDLSGTNAGGITGGRTGGYGGYYGDVRINNTYASGVMDNYNGGGIIGEVVPEFAGHSVRIVYSVYSNAAEMIGNDNHPKIEVVDIGNSNELNDIRGQLYHLEGVQQWDNDTWVINGTDDPLPILRFQISSPSPIPFPTPPDNPTDLRNNIIEGREPCFHYTPERSRFQMNCSVLRWKVQGYGPDTYISLGANETFDGDIGVGNRKSTIDLTGIVDFIGLFAISDTVTKFASAPLIRNVHMRNGTTAGGSGGFIVREKQKYFVVDSCSSTGDISGGGICGFRCGHENGEIRISNSHSTGTILASSAGGITGADVGYNGGVANIVRCYSTGNIEGSMAGGISGERAGNERGQVYITQSYSTGDISESATTSGGIVGAFAGRTGGHVDIEECYSTGEISADNSGGITGSLAAYDGGKINILNCYTRGDIAGQWAGGITGRRIGGFVGSYGDAFITNTYASGILKHDDGGGIIGHIESNFAGHNISVKFSVYNNASKMVGNDDYPKSNLITMGNSDDLNDIRDRLYHFDSIQRWDNSVWIINGTADPLPILRFQLARSSPSPTCTSIPTISATASMTVLPTATRTATNSKTTTPTMLSTRSPSASRTATPPGDLRDNIIAGIEACFQYAPEKNLFRMTCSVLHWEAQGYGPDTYIFLSANETFDGDKGENDLKSIIDLSGIVDFKGLFTINESVITFAEAPSMKNIHTRSGIIAENGGFIVREKQKYFIVDSCSSTGDITKQSAGGICGKLCGYSNGQVRISNSYSTGRIGPWAGGISGYQVGQHGGNVNITQCYSTGNLVAANGGGICGKHAGRFQGQVLITHSYSTGDILEDSYGSGGIVSSDAGHSNGYVRIQECFSTGQISATNSGGIIGAYAAFSEGEVHIVDCYTRGDIHGEYGGGIAGWRTGGCCGETSTDYGDVYINNTYASGMLKHDGGAGFIGSVFSAFNGHNIKIQYSVYDNASKMIGRNDYPDSGFIEIGNSGNLDDIRGQLYHYEGQQRWDNETWIVVETGDSLPILSFQLAHQSPIPSPTCTRTPTASPSGSRTPTPTLTPTATTSKADTPTASSTKSPSSSRSSTTSSSLSPSRSSSPTYSAEPTATSSSTMQEGTASASQSIIPISSASSTSSVSPTQTAAKSIGTKIPSRIPKVVKLPLKRLVNKVLPVQRPPLVVKNNKGG